LSKHEPKLSKGLSRKLQNQSAPRARLVGTALLDGDPSGAPPSEQPKGRSLSRGVVLLVEDNPALALAYARQLEKASLTVLVAGCGADAIAALEAGARPVAVWTDLEMGAGPDGIDVLLAAERCGCGAELLLVTSSPEDPRVRHIPERAAVFPKRLAIAAVRAASSAAARFRSKALRDPRA